MCGAVQAQTAEENQGQTFLQNFALSLVDIEDALDDSLGEFWNFFTDPVQLQVRCSTGRDVMDCSFLR